MKKCGIEHRGVATLLLAIGSFLHLSCSSSGDAGTAAAGGSGGAGGGPPGTGGRAASSGGVAGSGAVGGIGGRAGSGGGGGGRGGTIGTGGAMDAGAQDGGRDGGCGTEGPAGTDAFAGVWVGTQGGEAFTVTNGGGCTIWTGTIAGTLCDYCVGTYASPGADGGAATIKCEPRNTCSFSVAHTDTGTLSRLGCSLTYGYSFGVGNGSWTGARVSDAPAGVCSLIDGGTH